MESSQTLMSADIRFLVRILSFIFVAPGVRIFHASYPPGMAVRVVCTDPKTSALYPPYALSRSHRPLVNMLSFQDTQLALIHVPLRLYNSFLQAILQLLLPATTSEDSDDDSNGAVQPPDGWDDEQIFINISMTPVECSIVCSRKLMNELFVPVLDTLNPSSKSEVYITREDFVVMQLDGEGLDADRKVLELTGPLALAGM